MVVTTPKLPITHVLFDMDGLLLDTEALYSKSIQEIVGKYDKTYTWDLKVKLMGMTTKNTAETIVREMELPITADEFIEMTKIVYGKNFPTASLLPGVDKLVRHLHKHQTPIAIATSSSESSFNLKTTHHREFFELFHHRVSGSDDPEVKEGKPAPDIFLVCAARFEIPPDDLRSVLVFEDSPSGVEAAVAAGMPVVMVPDPRVEGDILKKPNMILTSLEEFRPEEFGLPPYDN